MGHLDLSHGPNRVKIIVNFVSLYRNFKSFQKYDLIFKKHTPKYL